MFIEIRYAHRHDSPGCSKIEGETVVIEENYVQLYVVCVQGTQKIRYQWSVMTYAEIIPEESTHSH